MSYHIKIRHTADSGNGVSVEARVNGEPVAHTFPKGRGFFDEPENGKPRFVEKLEEKYEEKMKREGRVSVQETSTEEAKIHSSHFENKIYGNNKESFKQEDKEKDIMRNIDLDNPDEIRDYLKENMAEGYLSDEEGMNIDKFVDGYDELLELRENIQEIIRRVQEGRVQ